MACWPQAHRYQPQRLGEGAPLRPPLYLPVHCNVLTNVALAGSACSVDSLPSAEQRATGTSSS